LEILRFDVDIDRLVGVDVPLDPSDLRKVFLVTGDLLIFFLWRRPSSLVRTGIILLWLLPNPTIFDSLILLFIFLALKAILRKGYLLLILSALVDVHALLLEEAVLLAELCLGHDVVHFAEGIDLNVEHVSYAPRLARLVVVLVYLGIGAGELHVLLLYEHGLVPVEFGELSLIIQVVILILLHIQIGFVPHQVQDLVLLQGEGQARLVEQLFVGGLEVKDCVDVAEALVQRLAEIADHFKICEHLFVFRYEFVFIIAFVLFLVSIIHLYPLRLRLLPPYLVQILLRKSFQLDLALEAIEQATLLPAALLLVVEGHAFLKSLGKFGVQVQVAGIVRDQDLVGEEAVEHVLELCGLLLAVLEHLAVLSSLVVELREVSSLGATERIDCNRSNATCLELGQGVGCIGLGL